MVDLNCHGLKAGGNFEAKNSYFCPPVSRTNIPSTFYVAKKANNIPGADQSLYGARDFFPRVGGL